MSGGSSANNSWTILTPEESAAETLRPLAEGTENHEKEPTLASGSVENQPASGAESAEGLPLEAHLVPGGKPDEQMRVDTNTEQHASPTPTVNTDAAVASSVSLASDADALSQSEGLPEGPALSGHDPDSFSDSYSHIAPSPDEPSATQLNIETLGGAALTQEEQRLSQEGTVHHLNEDEGAQSHISEKTSDFEKRADSAAESEVGEQNTAEEVRRRRSLLAALERIGRTEEEEEREEEPHLPQREQDSGFTVNKCILGAVILLGIGTIFFSGVFMDLDEESDYGTRELKDSELPTKQEDWLNLEALPPVDADNKELLNSLAKGNEQISVLQAQLQAQKEELKVAKGQAAEGVKERLRWEEVERENSRLKKETASLPVLQKENERLKRELESVRALQKELETLRATLTESKQPPAADEATQRSIASSTSSQPEVSLQGTAELVDGHLKTGKNKETKEKKKKEEKVKEKSEWKEKEKKEHKDEGKKEGKKEKREEGKFEKEKYNKDGQKRYSDEIKQGKDKEWQREKANRGDEGKPWKDREGSKQLKEKNERKEWKEEKDWKKAKHEELNEGKQWREKKKMKEEEKKDWKVGKEHGEKHGGREDWRGENKWKKGKDGYKESGKEQWERGEKREWKKDGDQSRNGKDNRKEGKWKAEKKPWEESKSHGKDRKGKDEGEHWNEWRGENDKSDDKWKRKDERKQHENKWKSKNDNLDEGWRGQDEGKRNKDSWKSKNGKHDKEWKKTDERREWTRKEEHWKKGGHKDGEELDRDTSGSHKHGHERKSSHGHQEEHVWGERKPSHTHRRLSPDQPEYWVRQRSRLQHNPKPSPECSSVETSAQTEGLLPVPFPEFEAVLQSYLTKAEEQGVDASIREELRQLTAEFFKDGVFVHDQMDFRDFVEDVGDALEDMVEGDDDENDEEDSDLEEEMEEFEREVMKKFSLPGAGEKAEKAKGEWRKESGRGRG